MIFDITDFLPSLIQSKIQAGIGDIDPRPILDANT